MCLGFLLTCVNPQRLGVMLNLSDQIKCVEMQTSFEAVRLHLASTHTQYILRYTRPHSHTAGDTYNRLLEEGYMPDVPSGVLLAPEDGGGLVFRGNKGGAGGSSSQQRKGEGEGAAGGSVGTASGGSSRRPPRFQW